MSVTLATMADALIEFILSLLRDPDAAAEFDADPEGTLDAHGFQNVSAADICAVAPVIVERPQVVPAPSPREISYTPSTPAVHEIRQITNQFSYTDSRSTIIDQSVNQAIWAHGDVTQYFDNDAVVASGDGAMAAGDDLAVTEVTDKSTTITAGGDANVGNDTDVSTVIDTDTTTTETTTITDSSTDTSMVDSGNSSTADVIVEDSFDDSSSVQSYDEVDVEENTIVDSTESTIIDDSADDDI